MPNYTIKLNDLGVTEFSPHLNFNKNWKYEVGLLHALVPKSWYNISSEIGNNTFTFAGNPYIIEDGHYDLDSLLEIIRELTGQAGIDLIGRRHSGFIKVVNGTASDLILEGIAPVLGFANPTTITAGSNSIGSNKADFSGGINEIELHCDLVDRRYTRHQGRTSNILKSVIADSQPLNHIPVVREIHYVPMNNADTLSSINIELKDQNGRDIDINGGSAEITIHIRPIKE